jgi:hypothetical protein|tara:strand:- start:141 stop:569 length:429 start_codon:yes stop_codon:yes gene_type:complete
MIILTTSAAAQTLSVVPRIYSSEFTMSIRDDSTNVKVFYEIQNAVTSGNYSSFTNIFNPVLVENHFYNLELYVDYNFWNTNYGFWQLDNFKWNEDERQVLDIYNDKIFCTDQDINQLENDNYQLNKGEYVHYNGFDNTYQVP